MLDLKYDEEYGGWFINGKKAKKFNTTGDHTRMMFKYGSDTILKVDCDIAQSLSEFLNYFAAPAKWRKYLVPVESCGNLPEEDQYYEGDETRQFGWVLQKRIPILRLDDWVVAQRKSVSRRTLLGMDTRTWQKAVHQRAQLMDDFAKDLIEVTSWWQDASQRQYSIVKGKVMVHDYASCRIRTDDEYKNAEREWDAFDKRWSNWESVLNSPIDVLDTVPYIMV